MNPTSLLKVLYRASLILLLRPSSHNLHSLSLTYKRLPNYIPPNFLQALTLIYLYQMQQIDHPPLYPRLSSVYLHKALYSTPDYKAVWDIYFSGIDTNLYQHFYSALFLGLLKVAHVLSNAFLRVLKNHPKIFLAPPSITDTKAIAWLLLQSHTSFPYSK